MPNPNVAWTTNADSALTTPTYDGSGEACHPDVYDAGAGNTWNGYRYWMAMTPYPGGDASKENPSILASADGTTWVVPAGLTNPIEGTPGTGGNSDTDLFLDGSTMYCFWRWYWAAGSQDAIYYLTSTNGINWGNKTLVQSGGYACYLSPSVVKLGSEYQLYTLDASSADHVIRKQTASAITGPWSSAVAVTLEPATSEIWHINVTADGSTLHMVFMRWNEWKLYYAVSEDGGNTWYVSGTYLLWPLGGAAWDETWIYRSCLVKRSGGDGFDLWYTGMRTNGAEVWHIGRSVLFSWPWDQNQKQLYVLVKNHAFSGHKLTHCLTMMQAAGEYQTMPAYINHRRDVDANTKVYEARMNTAMLTADAFKNRVALLANVAPAAISVTTTTPSYGGHTSTKMVLDLAGVDQVTAIVFGTATGTWEQSRVECKGYLGI